MMLRLFTAALLTALLSGCFVYKIDVQQGNEIDQTKIAQLEAGMSKRDVQTLLGTPLVNDPFHKDRWDYIYLLKKGQSGKITRQAVSVIFVDGKLSEIIEGEPLN